MNDLPVISNASSLIALAQIDHLDLLKQLFQTIVISSAVVEEISPTVSIPNWIEQHELSQSIDPFILQSSLGPGECETISLALEIHARFLGVEMHLGWRPNTRLNLEFNGSYVRGENRDEHLPLPEMPPLKFVGSATYEHPWLTVGGTAEFVAGQERVDVFEEPTDGYTVFGAYAQRDIVTEHIRHSLIVSLDNLFNTEYRNHLSRIRSVMPETGRSIKAHYKLSFF